MPRAAGSSISESMEAALGFTTQNWPMKERKSFRISSPQTLPVSATCCSISSRRCCSVGLHGFGVDAADVDQLVVVAIDEVALQVEHIGEAAGEAGAEVDAGAPEHAHDTAGHVLAAVIAGAFDRPRWRRSCAPRSARRRRPAANSCPPVAPYRQVLPMMIGVVRDEARRCAAAAARCAARHAFADVVVGIAFEVQVQAAGIPDAEALARRCP